MKIFQIFLILLLIAGMPTLLNAQGRASVENPENYIDKVLPTSAEGIVVFGRYMAGYTGMGQLDSFLNNFVEWFDSNTFTQEDLDSVDQQIMDLYSGVAPGADWAVYMDVQTFTIYSKSTAQDFGEGSAFASSDKIGTDIQIMDYTQLDDQGNPTSQTYHVLDAVNFSPIIIDVNNDGKPDVTRGIYLPHAPEFFKERTAKFDMNGDGLDEYIEWLGPGDALLVKPEADGTVKNALNLFGTAGGYKDGYEKMVMVLDADKNGWVEGDELNGLFVWTDINGNAKVDSDEMKSVQDLGIEKISTSHKDYESVCIIKGKEVKTWDWWPAGYTVMEKGEK